MEPEELARERLDPFLLPPATTSRFLLLVVLTLGAAAYTFTGLVGGSTGWADRYARCADAADAARAEALAVTQQYVDCYVGVSLLRAGVGMASALAVAVVLVLLYVLHPRWLIRWQNLMPLNPADYPVAAAEITRLIAEAGLKREPVVLVRPFEASRGGRAFGRWPNYVVRLDRGLVHGVTEETMPVLRAVVRHELAHLRNGDVDRTVLAIVSGWAFLAVVVVPQVVTTALTQPAGLVDLGWRLALTSVLVFLVRASVIRAREHYADVRASTHRTDDPLFLPEAFPGRPRGLPRPNDLLHPATAKRAEVVAEPGLLLRAGAGEALATGVTVGMVLPYATNLAALLLPASPLHGALLASVVLGAFTVAVIGVSLWRATLRALATGAPLPGGAAAGSCLAAGVLAGAAVSSAFDAKGWVDAVAADPAQGIAAAVVLWLGCLVFCRWAVGTAAVWLPAGRDFRSALRWGQVVAALVFGAGLAAWSTGVVLVAESGSPWSLPLGAFGSALDALVLLPYLLAACYPLLAGSRVTPRPVWLDSADEITLPRPRLHLRLVLIPPVALFLVVVLVEHVLLPDGFLVPLLSGVGTSEAVGSYARTLFQTYGLIAVIGVVQLVAVLLVSALAGSRAGARLAPAHALVSGVLTGHLLTVALIDVRAARLCASDGCEVYNSVLTVGSAHVVVGVIGLCATAAATPLVAGVRALVFRLRERSTDQVLVHSGRRWPRRLALAFGVVVLLAYVVPLGVYWAATTGPLRGRVGALTPEAVVNAAEPGPADSVGSRGACEEAARVGAQVLEVDAYALANNDLGRQLAASGSPALRAFGRVLFDSTRRGDQDRVDLALQGVTTYCRRVLDGTPVDEPPPAAPATVLAFGHRHVWPDGESITIGEPVRFTSAAGSLAVMEVVIGNGTSSAVEFGSFLFTGEIGDLRLTPFPVPVPGADGKTAAPGGEARVYHAYPLLRSGLVPLRVRVVSGAYGSARQVVFEGDIPATMPSFPTTTTR